MSDNVEKRFETYINIFIYLFIYLKGLSVHYNTTGFHALYETLRTTNRKFEGTRGEKHSRCATPNVHIATSHGILSGDVACSQAQRTYSRTAIGWRSMELVSKFFDKPT